MLLRIVRLQIMICTVKSSTFWNKCRFCWHVRYDCVNLAALGLGFWKSKDFARKFDLLSPTISQLHTYIVFHLCICLTQVLTYLVWYKNFEKKLPKQYYLWTSCCFSLICFVDIKKKYQNCYLKSVQVNFVVDTVVTYYCIYYEIYLNSL